MLGTAQILPMYTTQHLRKTMKMAGQCLVNTFTKLLTAKSAVTNQPDHTFNILSITIYFGWLVKASMAVNTLVYQITEH